MIATVAEIKSLLGITASTYDTRIAALMPPIQNFIIHYCNNDFLDDAGDDQVASTGKFVLTVAAGPVYSFDLATATFQTDGFASGDSVYLSGSARSDGYFTISALTETKMTVSELLYAETPDDDISLTLVNWPDAMQLVFAQMVNYRLHNVTGGVMSESLGQHSVTYSGSGGTINAYPAEILAGLDPYRRPRYI